MEYKNIECSLLKPFNEANFTVNSDNIAANSRLNIQPMIADVLFLLKPPTKYIVIIVENRQIKNVAIAGLTPARIIGDKRFKIKIQVNIIDTKL